MLRVKVLFFGILKDIVGRSQDELELPEGARLETVFKHYTSQFPRLREMADSIALARNQEFAHLEALLGDQDEVAFMPPVSGGSESAWISSTTDDQGNFYGLTREPIEPSALARRVLHGEDGALITFEGVVRNHSGDRKTRFLDYECYVPLALKSMQKVGEDVLRSFEIHRVAMAHRLGRLQIGETSVAIVVAAAHRKPAYEASLEAINRLKRLVPIWKKEYFEDGEVWVEGEWEKSVPRPARAPQ